MGCASSKLDDLPAVLLCRDRLQNLSKAVQHRHDLAQANLQYVHALNAVGGSLHRFFDNAASSSSPSITINEQRKLGESEVEEKKKTQNHKSEKKKSSGHLSSDEDSGSHLHFHSDDEDEDDDDDEELHHDHGSGSESGSGHLPHHQEMEGKFAAGGMMMYEEGSGFGGGGGGGGYGFGSGSGYDYNPYLYSSNGYGGGGGGGGTVHMNYMRKHVTPSVSYEQRPMSYETQTVQFGDPSNSNYYDYFGGGGGGGGGYFGPAPGPQRGGYYGPPMGVQPMKQQQQQAPPPPPPPAASSWDFMHLFESLDTHYNDYRPPSSRDSREVREEEGIPELEEEMEEGYAHEVVKEVHGQQKVVVEERGESSSSGGGEAKRGGEVEEAEEVVVGVSEVESGNVYRGRPSVSMESEPVEYEVRMVDKKVVGEEGKGGDGGGGGGGGRPGFRNVFEVVKEIQIQFERAANCGSELGNVLEVGKLRYQRKNAAFQGWEIEVS